MAVSLKFLSIARRARMPAAPRRSRAARRVRALLLASIVVLSGIAVAAVLMRWRYEADRADWIPLQRGSTTAVRQRILAWSSGQFAESSNLAATLAPLASADRTAADSAALALSASGSVVGVWLVDASGNVIVGRRNSMPLLSNEVLAAKRVIAGRLPTVVGPQRLGGGATVTVIVPTGRASAIIRRLDADSTLFQLADWGQSTTETAQIILLAHGGDSVTALTPLRLPSAPAGSYTRSLATASQLWRVAASGQDTSGYFVDERGKTVLASVLRMTPLPWTLLVQLDEDEVMVGTRRELRIAAALTVALVALVILAMFARGRARRVSRLRQAVEAEARFHHIVSSAMDAILTTDAEGIVTDLNPAVAQLFGVEASEVQGTRLDAWLDARSDGGPIAFLLEVSKRGGEAAPRLFQLRKSPHECLVEVTGSATRAPDGRETITLFMRDVTERRRMEETVRRTEEIALIGRVAGGLAHDFNNGLLVISGNAELIRDELDRTSQAWDHIAALLEGTHRIAHLTSQLLSFGRQQMLRPEQTDIVEFIRSLEPMIRLELAGPDEASPRTLRMISSLSSAFVNIDRRRFAEAVLHLVANARQAMPAWGQLTIEIAPSSENNALCCVSIRDTGVGMSAQTLARARQPFFSTRPRAVAQGLGLAVVEGIVEQSGGSLTLASTPGKGTIVTIHLPAAEQPRESAVASVRQKKPTPAGVRGVALIVDDENAVRRVVARCVRSLGFETIEAPDAEQALAMFAAKSSDVQLVVTDVVMPGMDGVALRTALLERDPLVHVILMSGYTDDELTKRGLKDTGATFLSKPFSLDELRRVTEGVLRPAAPAIRMPAS